MIDAPIPDVAIVGFGPVGAVMACLLAHEGLTVHVVDAAEAIYDKPRAVALDHEIARVLQGIGLGPALEACSEPFTDSVHHGADGRVIRRLTMLPEPHPQAWTPSMVFLQPRFEAEVRRHAAALPGVSIALGRRLVGLEQQAYGVTLAIEGPDGPETCHARFAIGCDGAGSTTRKLAGLGLEDLGFDEPWLVVDVLAQDSGLAKLPQTSAQFCEPARPTTFVIGTGRHRRWEFRLDESEDPRAMEQPEAVWRLLSRWIEPADATLWRSASYRFHALVARDWRRGRVFIAGDAGHQQPPFLGQGLCQGIRDAANLAWKLGSHSRGAAGTTLLDSYGLERGGHIRALTGIIRHIGATIGERDPARAAERDNRLIAETGGAVRPVPRQELMPALADGFLDAARSPGSGTLFPQAWIKTGEGHRRMDDVTGGGFRLVAKEPVEPALADAMAALGGKAFSVAQDQSADLCEVDGLVAGWLAHHGAAYALVRPDHYVFGTAATAAEAELLINGAGRTMNLAS